MPSLGCNFGCDTAERCNLWNRPWILTGATSSVDVSAGGGGERPQLFVHVAAGDLGDAPGSARLVVHTPLAGTPGSKSRRFGRRPAPWLDPGGWSSSSPRCPAWGR